LVDFEKWEERAEWAKIDHADYSALPGSGIAIALSFPEVSRRRNYLPLACPMCLQAEANSPFYYLDEVFAANWDGLPKSVSPAVAAKNS
jgi:hypothetical protein